MKYQMIDNVLVVGEPLDNAVDQAKMIDKTADRVALMADHHKGYSMPIGGVAAYKDKISPSGVGYDIGCGNKAVQLDLKVDQIGWDHLEELMDEIYNTISFGIGLKNQETVQEWSKLEAFPAWDIPEIGALKEKAHDQLGTVGGGNHFVDLFRDGGDYVWIGVHFGSRGLGHGIAKHYIKAGGGKDGMDVAPVLLDVDSALGQEYLAGMLLAGAYAYYGRNWVCNRVAQIVGAPIIRQVHNHHNYAWNEEHFGERYWVIRKGATPLHPWQSAFIGGSMGDISVIVDGVDNADAQFLMYSAPHGAGRLKSRTWAAGRTKFKNGKRVRVKEGHISREMMLEYIEHRGVVLRGAGTDEAPQVYKPLRQVLDAHSGALAVKNVLDPIGVCMAPANEYDPYKD